MARRSFCELHARLSPHLDQIARRVAPGSVILSLRTASGSTLAKFETNPRHIQPLKHAGDITSIVASIIAADAGAIFCQRRLAHYGVRLIDRKIDIGTILVAESSVPGIEMSGYPEGPLVIGHRWTAAPAAQPRLAAGSGL